MKFQEVGVGCLAIGGGIIAIALIAVALTIAAFVGSWCSAAATIVSPQNVKAQFRDAYTSYESLKGVAVNICNAQNAYKAETDSFIKSQRLSQLLAQEGNYQRIERQYDAQMDDVFRGRIVGPPDLPKRAPTVNQLVGKERATSDNGSTDPLSYCS